MSNPLTCSLVSGRNDTLRICCSYTGAQQAVTGEQLTWVPARFLPATARFLPATARYYLPVPGIQRFIPAGLAVQVLRAESQMERVEHQEWRAAAQCALELVENFALMSKSRGLDSQSARAEGPAAQCTRAQCNEL